MKTLLILTFRRLPTSITNLAIAVLFLFVTNSSFATSHGLAAILFDAWDETSVSVAASMYNGASGDVQIAVWGRGNYKNLTDFTKAALPNSSFDSLKVTVYLVFEPHDFGDGKDPIYSSELWGQSPKPTNGVKITDRATAFNGFANDILAWLNTKKLASKIRFTVVPALEDRAPENVYYSRILADVKSRITAPGVSYRRNPLHNAVNAVRNADNLRLNYAMPIELHTGAIPTVTNFNHYKVDVWTNDGYDNTTISQFDGLTTSALRMGMSALYWDSSFNWGPGQSRGTALGKRKPTPFVNNTGFVASVKKFLQRKQ